MEEKRYYIGLTTGQLGNWEYVVKEFVKRHFLDDYVPSYTYEEAVEKANRLNEGT